MSNFKLNLPTDIPWMRKCVSEDMIDNKLCDAKSPLRWRSSIVVFEYRPEDEFQNYEGMIVSYLKVTCSITGYQEDPKEIGLNYKGLKSYWKDQPGIDNYLDVLQKYYACYGAVLEVTVGPQDNNVALSNFPYFLDFEPKKRELFETATDTDEKMSRSTEALNLTKSAGTTQSLEVFDIDMGGGGFSSQGSFAGTGGGFSYSAPNGQWGTKRMNADESMSSRSADVGQEKRETFSHSTQISQLYHQLDSYHIGTNRALFFITPRPHTIETEHTFVNGPRNIEGVQEFMFVVARPKDVEHICVEAYLETGHIGKTAYTEIGEVPNSEMQTTWSDAYHAEPKGNDDETTVYDSMDRIWNVNSFYPGYSIKNAVMKLGDPDININDSGAPNLIEDVPHIANWNKDLITVSGRVRSWFENVDIGKDNIGRVTYPFTVNITLVKTQVNEKSRDTLFITGRKLCCCNRDFIIVKEGVVFEKELDYKRYQLAMDRYQVANSSMPIVEANKIGQEIKNGIINSRTDVAHRHETFLNLSQTDFANKALLGVVKQNYTLPLNELNNIPDSIKRKLSGLNSHVKVSDLLAMPFEMQKDVFGMNDKEVIELRNAISGVSNKEFDPKEAWLSDRQIQSLFRKDDKNNYNKP